MSRKSDFLKEANITNFSLEGATPGISQVLFLLLCPGITPGRLRELYGKTGIELTLTVYKANFDPTCTIIRVYQYLEFSNKSPDKVGNYL